MLSNNLVSNVMNSNIIPINSNDTLGQAATIFKKVDVRHLPVIRDNEVIGMIAKSDIERVVSAYKFCVDNTNVNPDALECVPVSQIMTQKLIHIQSDQTIEEAAEILTERAFRALPVLDGDQLVGVISTTSLMKYVVHEMSATGVYI
jgi:CBS domain-containing protein